MNVFLSAILIIALDQTTKIIVLRNNPSTYINRGIIWGLFKGSQLAGWLYTIAWFVLAFYLYLNHNLNDLSLGLILGGTISNKIDRFRVGGAVDWINIWGPIRRFNIADIGIVLGLLIWLVTRLTQG